MDTDETTTQSDTLDAEFAEATRVAPPRAVYGDIPAVKPGWEIGEDPDRPSFTEKQQLAWCLRKGSEHENELESLAYVASKEREAVMAAVEPRLAAIDDWLSDASSGETREMEWFRERLSVWAITDRAGHLDESRLTKLPSGSVSTTYRKPAITVDAPDLFLKWWQAMSPTSYFDDAADNDVASADVIVSWKPQVSLKALRGHADYQIADDKVLHTPTGELVPGLGVSEADVVSKVKWG